jgi:hypothetical protein
MTKENLFSTAKQTLVVAPKTNKEQVFIYKSIADLENLIKFIGTAPKVNIEKGKMLLSFGKMQVPDVSVVFRSAYGEVLNVLTFEAANEKYDIMAQREFDSTKDSQTPQEKIKKLKEKK